MQKVLVKKYSFGETIPLISFKLLQILNTLDIIVFFHRYSKSQTCIEVGFYGTANMAWFPMQKKQIFFAPKNIVDEM